MNKFLESLMIPSGIFALTALVGVGLPLPSAAASPRVTLTATQADFKATVDQINALRAEPKKARELLDKFLADAFTDPKDRNEVVTDQGNRKNLDDFIKFMESLPKMEPLQWDKEILALATSGGKLELGLYNTAVFDAFDDNPKKSLLWTLLRGVDFHYKPIFNPKQRSVGIGVKDNVCYIAVGHLKDATELKAMAAAKFKADWEAIALSSRTGRPYDPREDENPPWNDALSIKQPNIISFVRPDGSLDIVWRDMGVPPRTYLTRYSASGTLVFSKEVPGASASDYPLLAGFTEDPQGNLYIARAKDEGYYGVDQPDPPRNEKGELDPTWDRPDVMVLTKLSKDGAELWTKNYAKKGEGGALGFISPLSPNGREGDAGRIPGRDSHSSTSRIGFIVHKGTPIIFVIYGASTEWDSQIKGRHQGAYWRALSAESGEPVEKLSGAAMSHSFDSQLLVSDEGIITVERSDSGLLMGNYLNTRAYPLIFDFFLPTTTDGNNSFTLLGSLQPASDGYLVLFAGNNTPVLKGTSVSGEASTAEMIRNRNLAVIRVKKGFAQEIDALADKPEKEKVLNDVLNSMVRSPEREALQRTGRVYLTRYDANEKYSAVRPKMVRLADGSYIVLWERWTHNLTDDKKNLEGAFDSTWAMKIDQDGKILKPAVKLSETARITRGDEPVLWGGKVVFLAGDLLASKLIAHTVDGELNLKSLTLSLN